MSEEVDKLIFNLKYYPAESKHERKLKAFITALRTENENLKCCGNCVALYSSCPQMKEQDLLPFNACEHWQWDNMTREERIKG